MKIMYDPMTGEPIEVDDEVVSKESESNEASVSNSNEEVLKSNENINESHSLVETSEIDSESDSTVQSSLENSMEASMEDNSEINTASITENMSAEETNSNTNTNYDSMTGTPIIDIARPKDNNKKSIYILLGIVAVVIVIAICFLGGLFSSKKQKVEKAIIKTMDVDSKLIDESNKILKTLQESDYNLKCSVYSKKYGSVEGSFIVSNNEKQLLIDTDIENFVPITFLGEINKNSIKAEIPQACDYLFTYNYRSEKDGYLVDTIGSDAVEQIDKILAIAYDAKTEHKDLEKKIIKLNTQYLNKLKFESDESKNFKVDGKKVDCKGYTVTIENDWLVDYFDEFTDIYLEEFEDTVDELAELGDFDSIKNEIKSAKKDLKDIPDIDITFYIYKKALAGIHFDAGKKFDDIDVYFRGGDFRAQNVIIELDGDEILSFKCSKKNDKETYKLKANNNSIEIEYNTKKGNIDIQYNDGYRDYEYECKLTSDGGVTNISFEDIEIPYVDKFDVDFELSKGSKLYKFTNTEEFDIGNADKHDIFDLQDSLKKDFSEEVLNLF